MRSGGLIGNRLGDGVPKQANADWADNTRCRLPSPKGAQQDVDSRARRIEA
jgi:hypothetical protein